jgi:hypothetical protein
VATSFALGRVRPRRVLIAVGAALLIGACVLALARSFQPQRSSQVFDPPVLAGQQLWGACAGGFYARHGNAIVVTSSGHCATEGAVAYEPDGTTVRGVFGPAAQEPSCPHPGHTCSVSDMDYLVLEGESIPWGHLNVVDLGTAGYREIPAGTRPLTCEDIAIGDRVEINGRNVYRAGVVAEKGAYLHAEDGTYFPCMVAAQVPVEVGDSGGAVFVRGMPAGVTSRSFGGLLGFTPLAEGLANLGLELCTTPDCGVAR